MFLWCRGEFPPTRRVPLWLESLASGAAVRARRGRWAGNAVPKRANCGPGTQDRACVRLSVRVTRAGGPRRPRLALAGDPTHRHRPPVLALRGHRPSESWPRRPRPGTATVAPAEPGGASPRVPSAGRCGRRDTVRRGHSPRTPQATGPHSYTGRSSETRPCTRPVSGPTRDSGCRRGRPPSSHRARAGSAHPEPL